MLITPDTVPEYDPEAELLLQCELVSGHPAHLTSVTWYRDHDPLLTEPWVTCDNETDHCTGDSTLIISYLDRAEAGAISCQGHNAAGHGSESDSSVLNVQCKC